MMNKTGKIVALSLLLSGMMNFEMQARTFEDYFADYADKVITAAILSTAGYYGYRWMYSAKKQEAPLQEQEGTIGIDEETELSTQDIASRRAQFEMKGVEGHFKQRLTCGDCLRFDASPEDCDQQAKHESRAVEAHHKPTWSGGKDEWTALAEHQQEKKETNRANTLREIRKEELDYVGASVWIDRDRL